jgi:hypothetical protein
VLLVSSRNTAALSAPIDGSAEAAAGIGCLFVVLGTAAVCTGFALLDVIVYGSRADPFAAGTIMALGLIAVGLTALGPVGLAGLARRLWRHEWRVASATAFALVGAAFLGVVALGWLHAPQLENEWLLPATTTLVAAAVAAGGGRSIRPFGAVAFVAVTVIGGSFGWGVASHLDVQITRAPRPMRAADAAGELMFDASESGEYEVRAGAGGCVRGRTIAAGVYGPGWEETDEDPAAARVRLGDTGLPEGPNDLFVCLRHGVASGEAHTVVVIDDTPPAPATFDVQPTTGASVHRIAATRTLTFSGIASEARPFLEMNGLPLHDLAPVDGHWSFTWTLSPITDQAAFAVVVEDEAGNTSRSSMIHVRFVGIDPAPITLPKYPGLSVECRGEPVLDALGCQRWAALVLQLHPEFLDRAVRFLLRGVDQYGSCYAETRGPDGFLLVGALVPCPKEIPAQRV